MAENDHAHRKAGIAVPSGSGNVEHCFPAELLDSIVLHLLANDPAFTTIAAFALVSHQFRQVALRRYFSSICIRSPRHWTSLCRICGIPTWARSLSSSSTYFRFKMVNLSHFGSLRTLELDFSGDGLSTQYTRSTLLLKNITAGLTRLKLIHLPRIDLALLSLIASRFVSVTSLHLSCTERLDLQCCWLCLEESSTCTVHSPIPDSFANIQCLADSFCNALAPLKNLQALFLGVFLSDAEVLAGHLERCAAAVITSPRTPNYYPTPPFGPNLCVLCCAQHATGVQERERLAKALFLKSLPSLINIGFSSWFPASTALSKEVHA